jgi:hypothetical protein
MSELSQEARDLIDSAGPIDDPSEADRARMRGRVAGKLGAVAFGGALGAATSSAVSASAGSTGAGASSVASGLGGGLKSGGLVGFFKLAVSASVAAVLGGSALWLAGEPTSALREPAPLTDAANRRGPAEPELLAPDGASAVPPQPTVEPLAQPSAAERVGAEPPATATKGLAPAHGPRSEGALRASGRAAGTEGTLSLELSLLARAQEALRGGNPHAALAIAREHRQRFARGSLRDERFGIEALARCALGHDGAEVVAELERLSPSSPLLARVRTACKSE